MPKSFYGIVHDLNTGNYSIEGPMPDDTVWIDAVAKARKAGQNVRFLADNSGADLHQMKDIAARSFEGKERPPGTIVELNDQAYANAIAEV